VKRYAKSENLNALLGRYIHSAVVYSQQQRLNCPLTKQDRKHFLWKSDLSFSFFPFFLFEPRRAGADPAKLAAVCLSGYRDLSTTRTCLSAKKKKKSKKRSEFWEKGGEVLDT